MSAKIKFWIAGLAMAAVGLILVKVVSAMLAAQGPVQLVIYLIGAALALGGLLVIMVGIRKTR